MYVLFRIARTEADRDSPQVNNSFEAFECDTITCQGLQQHPELLGAVRIFIWHSRLSAWLQLDDGSLAACQQQDPEKISLLVLAAQPAADARLRALDILRAEYPSWEVECCSESTRGRAYPRMQMQEWEIENPQEMAEIKNYLQQKLGNTVLEHDPRKTGIQQLAPLKSENDGNRKFGEYYGDPVAYIATETHSGVISFHVNPPTISATGEPDFLYYVNGNLELLRGEGKTPTVMGSAATMFPTREDATLQKCAKQICDYMRHTGRRYGWLTYLNGTFFVKKSPDGPDLYKFTRALPSRFANLTVLEMLTYVVLKQLEEGPWTGLPANQPAIAVDDHQELQNVQDEPITTNSTHAVTRSRATALALQAQGMACSSGALQSHADWALQISSKQLGSGQCGVVIEGRYYGEVSAIKAMDLSKRYKEVGLLTNELSTYGHLAPLQGQCIPVLMGHGLWDNGNTMFLAMSVVEGEHPSSNMSGAREAAAKALRRIHDMGVLHGDIRRENILISKTEEDWQVWFVDFGHSSMSGDAAAQALELEELARLFRQSSDSGVGDATMHEA